MDEIEKIEAHLGRSMVIIASLGGVVFLSLAGVRAFCAFALGAALAILGYRWLARAVASALNASAKPVSGGIVRNLILRYVLAIGAIVVTWQTQWLPIKWMAVGLLVPAAGALAESVLLLGKMLHAPTHG